MTEILLQGMIILLFVCVPIGGIIIISYHTIRILWARRGSQRVLISNVKGHEGGCIPIWINTNQMDNRLYNGVTGFFKNVRRNSFGMLVKYGEEFHGIIESDGVNSTEGRY